MKLTSEAKTLIKKREGLRLTSYRCPAGVLTIGYGHTSAAGEPVVTAGMKITKTQAENIFDHDIETFAKQVAATIPSSAWLPDGAFSACVSLAFNIGLGAWKGSSVLKFIKLNRLDDAADAFLLWNKATVKGKRQVLPGLTSRRAAEAALFTKAINASKPSSIKLSDDENLARIPDKPEGKSGFSSSTNIAAGVTAVASVSGAAKELAQNTSDIFSLPNILIIVIAAVAICGALWIIKERQTKAKDWAV